MIVNKNYFILFVLSLIMFGIVIGFTITNNNKNYYEQQIIEKIKPYTNIEDSYSLFIISKHNHKNVILRIEDNQSFGVFTSGDRYTLEEAYNDIIYEMDKRIKLNGNLLWEK